MKKVIANISARMLSCALFFSIPCATASAAIKNIIFDFGGVLLELEHMRTAQAFEELGAPDFRSFYSQNQQSSLVEHWEAGKVTPQEFRNFARERTGLSELADAGFDKAWNALIVGYLEEKIKFLEEMKEHYNIYLLSNTNEIHYTYFANLYQIQTGRPFSHFLGFFKKAYFSHIMGLKKPNADAYEIVLDENNLKPAETVFVDDTAGYIEGAQRVGIHTLMITKEVTLFTLPDFIKNLSASE